MIAWWQLMDDQPSFVPSMEVHDSAFVQPIGFIWFYKPRYRVKAKSRKIPA